jgi:hypothetical protein
LVHRYYDPQTDQFLSVDPDVMETGQPYAFTGDDPLNATDPLGLDKVYVIRTKSGRIKYVGRTNQLPRREREHIKSGKLDEKNGDTIEELDTPELSNLQVKGVEQIVMDRLKSLGVKLTNKINSISPKNPEYGRAIDEGDLVLEDSPNALRVANNGSADDAAVEFQQMQAQVDLGPEAAPGLPPDRFFGDDAGGGDDDLMPPVDPFAMFKSLPNMFQQQ